MAEQPELRPEIIRAVQMAIAGDRTGARAIVDHIDGDTTVSWIRACLLKAEGDEAGARTWYRRSSQFYESFADTKAELAAIYAALTY